MYFDRIQDSFDANALEQAAALFECAQPVARAWLIAQTRLPGALVSVGIEGGQIQALAAGIIGPHEGMLIFTLQELRIASVRRTSGLGAELLAFTLRAAASEGAVEVHAATRLEATGLAFLTKHGFERRGGEGLLCKVI